MVAIKIISGVAIAAASVGFGLFFFEKNAAPLQYSNKAMLKYSNSITNIPSDNPKILDCAKNNIQGYPSPYEGVKGFLNLLSSGQRRPVACRYRIEKNKFLKERDFIAPYEICQKSTESTITVKDIKQLIDVKNDADLRAARCSLINNIYDTDTCSLPGQKAIPIKKRFENVPTDEWLEIQLPGGARSFAAILRPQNQTSNDLVIVHHGHKSEYLAEVVNRILATGRTVVYMWMPLYGPNKPPEIAGIDFKYHVSFWDLEQKVKFNPMVYFVDPVNQVINAMTGFNRVVMIGSSGGAYITHLYQALDRRVKIGFATAGGTPFFARKPPYNAFYPSSFSKNPIGDYEMAHPSIIGAPPKVSLLDLYVMAAAGNRRHYVTRMPFEKTNSGLSANFYAAPATQTAQRLGGKLEFVHDWSTCKHEISKTQLLFIEKQLSN